MEQKETPMQYIIKIFFLSSAPMPFLIGIHASLMPVSDSEVINHENVARFSIFFVQS